MESYEIVPVADVRWECTEGRKKCVTLFEDWLVVFHTIDSIGLTRNGEGKHRVYGFREGHAKV